MKIKSALSILALTAGMTAMAQNYTVNVALTEDEDGAMAYLLNYDSGDKVDSILVEDGRAVFSGTVAKPFLGRVTVDNKRLSPFIVEQGVINITQGEAVGTGYNDQIKIINDSIQTIAAEFSAARQANDEAAQQAAYTKYQEYMRGQAAANIDNIVGLYMFLQTMYDMSADEIDAAVIKYPQLKESTRVQKLLASNLAKKMTAPGNKFVDFTVSYDGKTHKLSDLVGKGQYVLADFWASWCGPCRREMATLKEMYKQYGDKLKIVGVAVWDEPDATLKAVKDLELPWEIWPNAGTVPTDAYGIVGIPCIILFGPDGTILVRDKQGEDLKAAVAEHVK